MQMFKASRSAYHRKVHVGANPAVPRGGAAST